jgi:hypothetical protein
MRVSFIGVSAALIFGSTAQAATLTADQGEIFVNRGSGYKVVREPVEVSAGDQVMAKPKSMGQVIFGDGCIMKVAPVSIFTVPSTSPCRRSSAHVETGGSLKDEPMPERPVVENRGDLRLFLGVAGTAAVLVLLPHKDKGASP